MRFKEYGAYATPPGRAMCALQNARTLSVFRELEDQGLVRIKAQEEEENYFDVYGEPDDERERERMVKILDRDGCWYVYSEYFSPETETWKHADGVGMCTGYSDPTDPFENCYVIGMMQEAIDLLKAETASESN